MHPFKLSGATNSEEANVVPFFKTVVMSKGWHTPNRLLNDSEVIAVRTEPEGMKKC